METDVLPIIYMLDISLLVLLVSDQRNNPFPCNVQIRFPRVNHIQGSVGFTGLFFMCNLCVWLCVCSCHFQVGRCGR